MAKKNQRNNATTNNTKEEKNMNTKTTKTTKSQKNTKINKEENIMKKNVEIGTVGASVTLTKVGTGTITFTQPKEHDKVIYTVFGVPTEITADEAPQKIAQFVANGWKIGEIIEHKASAPTPNYSEIYHQNLEEIQKGKKSTKKEQKTYAPKLKKFDAEKKPTYKEVIEEKYGSIEDRRKFAIRRSEVWKEEATKIADEVKKTGKRLRKDAWKKLMNERVTNRMKAEGFC